MSEEFERVSNIFALIEEVKTLRRALDTACAQLAKPHWTCPRTMTGWSKFGENTECMQTCEDTMAQCWKQYFMEAKE